MTDTEKAQRRDRVKLLELEQRVYGVESLVLRALVTLTGGLLGLGSVLTMFSVPDDAAWENTSLLTLPFKSFEEASHVDDKAWFGVVMGIGFLGLLSCVVIAIGICFAQWGRKAGGGVERTAKIVARLMLIGVWVPILLTFFVFTSENTDADSTGGPALWLLVPGMLLFAVTVLNHDLRRLWLRHPDGTVRRVPS